MSDELEEEIKHTHKAVLTVYSNGNEGMISVKVNWDPPLEGDDIKELGYMPAAFLFIQDYMLPAIEDAIMEWEVKPMMMLESPSEYTN